MAQVRFQRHAVAREVNRGLVLLAEAVPSDQATVEELHKVVTFYASSYQVPNDYHRNQHPELSAPGHQQIHAPTFSGLNYPLLEI